MTRPSLAAVRADVEALCRTVPPLHPRAPDERPADRARRRARSPPTVRSPRPFDGFEPRPGQRALAAEVARTFDEGGTLVAEAGTGTGKTLAYLVPAVLAGRRVLISTGTRTLQDQIFYKDVPALATRARHDDPRRLHEGPNQLPLPAPARAAGEADAGLPSDDRALARAHRRVGGRHRDRRPRGNRRPARRPAAVDRGDRDERAMPRPRLPAVCRRASSRACAKRPPRPSIVIVNHHLLCADAAVRQGDFGEVIPECDLTVIDEAHQLEDVVTQYFGVSVSTYARGRIRARRPRGRSAACRLRQGRSRSGSPARSTRRAAGRRRLFDVARLELRRRTARAIARRSRPTSAIALARRRPRPRRSARPVVARVAIRPSDGGATRTRARIGARADALRADAGAPDGRGRPAVRALRRGTRPRRALRAAPIDASRDHAGRGARRTARHRADLRHADRRGRRSTTCSAGSACRMPRTLRLPSEFDFRTPGHPLSAGRHARSADPGFQPRGGAEVIGRCSTARSGRAFVLFTSYAAMREVHA